jgi:hypothetical protein
MGFIGLWVICLKGGEMCNERRVAAPESGVLNGIICSLTDSAMALAPRGWVELELSLASTSRGLKLSEVKAQGAGGKEPKPKPNLGLEPQLEASRLSEGLTELSHLLAHAGKNWKGGKVQLTRGTGALDWKFFDAEGKQAWFTRLDQGTVDSLLVTDPLFDAISGTERAFTQLQTRSEERIGETIAHGFDAETGQVTLLREGSPPAVVDAEVMGFYYPEAFSWQWSWSNPSVPPDACEGVHRVCAPEAKPPGMSALWRAQYHCDEAFIWGVAGHIAVSVGARGIFRAELKGQKGVMLLALMGDVPPRGN